MPRLHTKQEFSALALAVSASMTLVSHRGIVYEAQDFETGEPNPSPQRTVWIPKTTEDIMQIAQALDILFANKTEFESFSYMVLQAARPVKTPEPYVMIRHEGKLVYMTDFGLVPVEKPGFVPNFIKYELIEKSHKDYAEVTKLFAILSEWVGGDEQAKSLLYHLATALQPGWSAVKYMLFIGEGRNGKGTLLLMIRALLGIRNTTGVQRQAIAAQRPIIRSLNNKLANIVFDGSKKYIADSGPEKTLTAGEPLLIELKYENEPFEVQTNALFIESLNKEPKAADKSGALQKRLVRFFFPNRYQKNLNFEKHMTSDLVLNAFLTLLWEHWVSEDEISTKLSISQASEDLQTSYELDRSPLFAWIEHVTREDKNLITKILSGSCEATPIADALQAWMQSQSYEGRTITAVWELLAEHFIIDRTTKRVKGRPTSVRIITRVLPETARALRALKGEQDENEAVVRES